MTDFCVKIEKLQSDLQKMTENEIIWKKMIDDDWKWRYNCIIEYMSGNKKK